MSDTPEDITAAEAQGWQSDFKGENKKTASEFLHDGRFFKQIDELKQQNTKLKASHDQLAAHYDKARASDLKKAEVEYQKTISDLKNAKVTALDEGDNHRVVEIDEEIRTTERPVEQPQQVNQAFDNWVQSNDWYTSSTFLQVEADKLGEQYWSKGFRGKELYDAIGSHVKELHPDKFTNQNRKKPPAVEEGSAGDSKPQKGKVSEKELTQDELTIFRGFKSNGAFKTDEAVQTYFRQVLEMRT